MRLDIHISDDINAVTALEARERHMTQSAVIRERLANAYGLENKPSRRMPMTIPVARLERAAS